jgi:hypothetical protein
MKRSSSGGFMPLDRKMPIVAVMANPMVYLFLFQSNAQKAIIGIRKFPMKIPLGIMPFVISCV